MPPLLDWLLREPWPGPALWALLYISDYYLTLLGAQLFARVQHHFQAEGGYELTPYYQADIASLRKVSPRFLVQLALSTGGIAAFWWLTHTAQLPVIYEIFLGAFLLVEAPVHTRHVRNVASYRVIARGGAVTGRVTYSHWYSLVTSAAEMAAWVGFYVWLWALTGRWFFAGGALKCLSLTLEHYRRGKTLERESIVATVADESTQHNPEE